MSKLTVSVIGSGLGALGGKNYIMCQPITTSMLRAAPPVSPAKSSAPTEGRPVLHREGLNWFVVLVDLENGGSFTFLGFEYRRILGRNRKWRAYYAPKLKKRTALVAKLKEIFRQNVSQPVEGVIEQINPILRGWVNYFALGDSSECFSFVRDWVEKKIRGHLMRARERSGLGWKRWSRKWLYRKLGLYNDYRLRRPWSLPKRQAAELVT